MDIQSSSNSRSSSGGNSIDLLYDPIIPTTTQQQQSYQHCNSINDCIIQILNQFIEYSDFIFNRLLYSNNNIFQSIYNEKHGITPVVSIYYGTKTIVMVLLLCIITWYFVGVERRNPRVKAYIRNRWKKPQLISNLLMKRKNKQQQQQQLLLRNSRSNINFYNDDDYDSFDSTIVLSQGRINLDDGKYLHVPRKRSSRSRAIAIANNGSNSTAGSNNNSNNTGGNGGRQYLGESTSSIRTNYTNDDNSYLDDSKFETDEFLSVQSSFTPNSNNSGSGSINNNHSKSITESFDTNISSEDHDLLDDEEEDDELDKIDLNVSIEQERRKKLNASIKEQANRKKRNQILSQPSLEDVELNEKQNLPPPFKKITPKYSKPLFNYSYTSSALFNNNSNNIFNSNNNNSNNLLAPPTPTFFSAKVDTANYIPTKTFGYNYHQDTGGGNVHVDIIENPILGNTRDLFISSSSSASFPPPSAATISLDDYLKRKEKENNIINNTAISSSPSSPLVKSKQHQSPITPSAIPASLPTTTTTTTTSNRSKLLESNYKEDDLSNISLRFASSNININRDNNSGVDDADGDYNDDGDDEYEHQQQDNDDDDEEEDQGFPIKEIRKLNNNENDEDNELIDQLYKGEKKKDKQQIPKVQVTTPTTALTTTTTTTTTTNTDQNSNNNNTAIPPQSIDSILTSIYTTEDEEDYCGSDIDGEDFSSVNIDYNERYQEIMEALRNIDCNSLQSDKIKVNSQFIALTQDFVYASQTYGKVIISERYLPNHEKTIPPIDIGGLAGGDKFIVHGILFKFAIDKENFYGSDYASMCVGGHELKGLINVFNCHIPHLSLPLMALVDYRGFRVIAMSILPVDKDSIYYGSNDYGVNIHNKDPYLSDKVKSISTILNLKSHHCGDQKTFLHSPADLEGHRGFDGRYYLLDFARLFPPSAPSKDIKMGHLFRLLRPEFVRNYKTPLCSDSFSRFIRGHNEQEHNQETLEATSYLLNTTIPELVEDLNDIDINITNIYTFPITERLHRSGVNVRYLGYIRQSCQSLDMKSLIFIEMCARVVKQQLRQKLRFKMKQAKIPLEAPYRRLIVAYLNRLLGISDKSDLFWNTKMKRYLIRKFDRGLFEDEIKGNSLILGLSSFSDHNIDGKYLLFKRIQKMTGLKFTNRINGEFESQPNCWLQRGEHPLDINDLDEIGIRVKYVPFMNVAMGYLFKVKGEMLFASDPIAATRFFHMALDKLEIALETDPNNTDTLCTIGEVNSLLGMGDQQGLSEVQLSIKNPYISKAVDYFQRSIFLNPNHTMSLFRFAQLLERCGEYDDAETYYLASLGSNPNNIACLQEYGNFLQTARNDFTTAELFFIRGSQNHYYLHTQRERIENPINIRGSSGLLKLKQTQDSNSSSSNLFNSNNSNNSPTLSSSSSENYNSVSVSGSESSSYSNNSSSGNNNNSSIKNINNSNSSIGNNNNNINNSGSSNHIRNNHISYSKSSSSSNLINNSNNSSDNHIPTHRRSGSSGGSNIDFISPIKMNSSKDSNGSNTSPPPPNPKVPDSPFQSRKFMI